MSFHSKSKPTYSSETRLTSCSVEKELLQELEDYILRKAKELEQSLTENEYCPKGLSANESYGFYTFTIEDSTGVEELSSVADFHLQYFPNDTKQVTPYYHSGASNNLRIKVKFGKEYYSQTDLSITYTGDAAREIVTGLASGVQQIIRPYRRLSYIFNHAFHQWHFICAPVVRLTSHLSRPLDSIFTMVLHRVET